MAKRTTAKSEAIEPEVIDAVDDVAIVKAEAGIVSSFLGGMAKFFSGATALETAAKSKLEAARKLKGKAITSADQDEKIQRMVKGASADIKGVEDYWEITSKLSQLHKRFVAGRQRPVAMLEEVKAIGNQLHNDWTDAERRRVAEENDRARRKAEADAAADRARELAQAEAAALKLEASSPDVSPREATYVAARMAGQTSTAAAQTAGFKDPAASGERLENTSKIQKALDAAKRAAVIRDQAAAIKAQPLDIKPIELAKPNVTKAAGAHDRTTWSGAIDDEAATIAAAFDNPALGIPRDLFQINPAKLNEYARSLEVKLNLWPGVRAVKKTGVV